MSGVNHIGRETTEAAQGREWRFSRWDRSVWVAFAEWAREKLPCPIEAMSRSIDKVALKDMEVLRGLKQADELDRLRHARELKACATDEERALIRPHVPIAREYASIADMLARAALDKAAGHLDFGSPELRSLLNGPIGSGRLVYLLLRKHQPEVTESDAFDVAMELGKRRGPDGKTALARVFDVTQGELPEAAPND